MTGGLCEIRIPTYKRPEWLRRAAASALAQDYGNVRVIIFEDSMGHEGRAVAESLQDPRVDYRTNPRNLGGAGNTSQAFTTTPLAGGEYFCVLDDDNWLLPTYVSANVKLLESSGMYIALRNQEVWEQSAASSTRTSRTTRGTCLSEGVIEPLDLYARLFVHGGISHGGMFWRTGGRSDLFVSPLVPDAGIQEYCRTLQVVEPIVFGAEPLAVFSEMTIELRSRSSLGYRRFGRACQAIHQFLIARFGNAVVDRARAAAARSGDQAELERCLLTAGVYDRGTLKMGILPAAKVILKAHARAATTENILREYLANIKCWTPATAM